MRKKRQSGRFAPLSLYISCSREMESRIFYPYLVTATRRVASGSPSDLPLTRYIPRCRLLRSRPSSVACTSSISLNCSSLPSKLYTSMRTAHPMYCVRSTFSSPSGSGTPRSYTAALCSPPSLSELRRRHSAHYIASSIASASASNASLSGVGPDLKCNLFPSSANLGTM